jgi:hypothetical protein
LAKTSANYWSQRKRRRSKNKELLANSEKLYEKIQGMTAERLEKENLPEFSAVTDWMIESLKGRIAELKTQKVAISRIFIMRRVLGKYSKLLSALEKIKSKKQMTYYSVNRAALNFSHVFNSETEAESWFNEYFAKDRRPGKYDFDDLANDLLRFAPHIIIVPTEESLTIADFNRVSDKPIFYLGLVSESTFGDGRLRSVVEYFRHDLAHTFLTLVTRYIHWFPHFKAFVFRSNRGVDDYTPTYNMKTAVLTEDVKKINDTLVTASDFRAKYEEFLETVDDPWDRLIMERLWFNAYHEFQIQKVAMKPSSLALWLARNSKQNMTGLAYLLPVKASQIVRVEKDLLHFCQRHYHEPSN